VEGPFLVPGDKTRSFGYADPWAASLGMTEKARSRALYAVYKNYRARRPSHTLHIECLTLLSNVVAYGCRHSRTEGRRHAHRPAFFRRPSTGDQSFALQGFAATRNG
jgi:hypothetical protein